MYVNYLSQMSPIYQGTENRILFIDSVELCAGEGTTLPPSATYHTSSTITEDAGGAAGAARGSLTLVAVWAVLVVMVEAVQGTIF